MRELLSVALALALAGCHTYVPVASTAPLPPPGTLVRAQVSGAAAEALAPQLGPGVTGVNGSVIRLDQNELALALQSVQTYNQGGFPWRGEQIRLDRQHIVRLEQKKFSPSRTALFVGSLVAAWFAVRRQIGGEALEPVDRTPPVNPM